MTLDTLLYRLHIQAARRRQHRKRNRLCDVIHRRIFRQRRLFDD